MRTALALAPLFILALLCLAQEKQVDKQFYFRTDSVPDAKTQKLAEIGRHLQPVAPRGTPVQIPTHCRKDHLRIIDPNHGVLPALEVCRVWVPVRVIVRNDTKVFIYDESLLYPQGTLYTNIQIRSTGVWIAGLPGHVIRWAVT